DAQGPTEGVWCVPLGWRRRCVRPHPRLFVLSHQARGCPAGCPRVHLPWPTTLPCLCLNCYGTFSALQRRVSVLSRNVALSVSARSGCRMGATRLLCGV